MDLQITRDRTSIFKITVTTTDPTTQVVSPVDLTGKSLAFEAKLALANATAVITKTSPSGGISINAPASAGIATLQIDPPDTTSLPNIQGNTLVYDLQLTDGANEYQLAAGVLTVVGNVIP